MPRGRVPMAPMPSSSNVCRWCRGPAPAGKCQALCLPSDAPAYSLSRLVCPECLRQHDTGRISHTEPCWECDRAVEALLVAEDRVSGSPLTQWNRGRYQRAMASRRAS